MIKLDIKKEINMGQSSKKKLIKFLYWFFIIAGIIVIGLGIYVILKNFGIVQ